MYIWKSIINYIFHNLIHVFIFPELRAYSVDNQALCPTTRDQRCKPFQRIWIKRALCSQIASYWDRILCDISNSPNTEIYERSMIYQVSVTIFMCTHRKKDSLTVEKTVDQSLIALKPGWHNRLPLISHMCCTFLCAMATNWKRSVSERKRVSLKRLLWF